MAGINIDPNIIKQQQEVMRANALKNSKEKPPKPVRRLNPSPSSFRFLLF